MLYIKGLKLKIKTMPRMSGAPLFEHTTSYLYLVIPLCLYGPWNPGATAAAVEITGMLSSILAFEILTEPPSLISR